MRIEHNVPASIICIILFIVERIYEKNFGY